MAKIDHFMYAVSSLDDGMAWAADTFDAAPAHGGAHIGLGTRNALLSLGDTYLEIIAPDPEQDLSGTMGARFAELSEPGLVTWAAQGDLSKVAIKLHEHGIACRGPNRTERRTAEGELLVWELLFPIAKQFGGCMPFFIDWLDCAHPSTTNPLGGQFAGLEIRLPDPGELRRVLEPLGLSFDHHGGEPGLSLTIECAKGPVTLSSTPETSQLTFG